MPEMANITDTTDQKTVLQEMEIIVTKFCLILGQFISSEM